MVAVTPGGGIQDNGRTPTMTIKPALWASALFAWAGINLIAAVDTVLPGGSGQVWAAGLVTAVAAAAGALIVRNMRANKQLVDQYIQLLAETRTTLTSQLEDERHAHSETRHQLQDATKRLARLERTVDRMKPEP